MSSVNLRETSDGRFGLHLDDRLLCEALPPVFDSVETGALAPESFDVQAASTGGDGCALRFRHEALEATLRIEVRGTGLVFEAAIVYRREVTVRTERLALLLSAGDVRFFGRDRRWQAMTGADGVFIDPWTPKAVLAGGGVFHADLACPGFFLAREGDRLRLEVVADDRRLHPLQLIDAERNEFPNVAFRELSAWSRREGDESAVAWRWSPWEGPPPSVPVLWPEGRRAALTWVEHGDFENLDATRAAAYGSVTAGSDGPTGGLVGHGLKWTKSVWLHPAGPVPLADIEEARRRIRRLFGRRADLESVTRHWLRLGLDRGVHGLASAGARALFEELHGRGVEICPHTLSSDRDETREAVREGLAEYESFSPITFVDHGSIWGRTKRESLRKEGLEPESPYYILDLLARRGYRYVWTGADRTVPAGDTDWNLFRPSAAGEAPTLLFRHPLLQGGGAALWSFSSLATPGGGREIPEQVVDRLLAEGGACVLHTAFGQMVVDEPDEEGGLAGRVDRFCVRLRRRLFPGRPAHYVPRWERRIMKRERQLERTPQAERAPIVDRILAAIRLRPSNGAVERAGESFRIADAFEQSCARLGGLVASGDLWNPTAGEFCKRLERLRSVRWRVAGPGTVEFVNEGEAAVEALSVHLFTESEACRVEFDGLQGRQRFLGDRLAIWFDLAPGERVTADQREPGMVVVRREDAR